MSEKATMKEWLPEDKPYEKCLAYGAGILSDAELLAVILRTGVSGLTAVDLSRTVLSAAPGEQGLLGLYRMSMPDMMKVRGIGMAKAVQLKAILELSRRIAKQSVIHELTFLDPSSIASYCMEDLRHEDQEKVKVMMFDTKNHLIGDLIVSQGTVRSSLISPREVFLQALHHHAVSLVLVHNHPSGDPTPSKEDIVLTERMREAGNILGIELLDHIIVGDRKYVSFRENAIIF